MLIGFKLENWMSYGDEVYFSMIASKERQHGGRLAELKKYKMRVLPIAAFYGGNASGKTNLFKALNFARYLIVKGTRPDQLIPVEPFRLNPKNETAPSKFCFELNINETIFEYSFSLDQTKIIEEKLVEILSSSERTLYERRMDDIRIVHEPLKRDKFLEYASRGTRENQLFLTNTVFQKIEYFASIYRWFKDKLIFIAPDTRFGPFEEFFEGSYPLYEVMNEILPKLDTGIIRLCDNEIPFDSLPFPEELKLKLKSESKKGTVIRLEALENERNLITNEDGELKVKELVTEHRKTDGSPIRFKMQKESDGTRRIIDLLPVFLQAGHEASSKVIVIDELDRSLHYLLTRKLIEGYLDACTPNRRSQILFTTHDVLLMDQSLLRRDEMWLVEKDNNESSRLISVSEYRGVRYDKDIRKSYLNGRFGGIPKISFNGNFSDRVSNLQEQ